MKKIKRGIFFIICFLGIIIFNRSYAFAEDDGYYIKHMDVSVEVNNKREYKIVETIDVYFNEERHGIIRNIPKTSHLEQYEFEDVSVEGAKSDISNGSDLNIKIGDKDEVITGDKRYIIKYTMKNFSDEQEEGDYIYLNILGAQWDTKVKKFTSKITYPEEAKLETIKITSDRYGSKDNELVDYKISGNTIEVNSKDEIEPNTAVTLNAMLNEGAFSEAPVKIYPYIIKSENINMDITKEKEYLVTKEYIIDRTEEEDGSAIINFWNSHNRSIISDITVDNDKFHIDSDGRYISIPDEPGEYKVKLKYKVTPSIKSKINIGELVGYIRTKTESLKITVKSPFPIKDYYIAFDEMGLNIGKERFEINNLGNSLIFDTKETMNYREEFNLDLDIDNSLFSRLLPRSVYIFYLGSILAIIVAFIFFNKKKDKNKLTPAVEIYPPKDLNTAEVAYIYKKSVSSSDITSLIFYWASQGYLKIKMLKDDKFKLIKTNDFYDINNGKDYEKNYGTNYEKKLFDETFRLGNGSEVHSESLKGKLYEYINIAIGNLKVKFKGDKEILDKKSYFSMTLITLINIIPITIFSVISNEIAIFDTEVFVMMIVSLGIAQSFVLTLILYFLNSENYAVGNFGAATPLVVILGGLYALIISAELITVDVPYFLKAIVIISTFLISFMASMIPKRTEYGKEKFNEILGFRNFIKVAEKERLEALIESEPEYFYNTLPYAQVLGLTKVWKDKFKDITLEPPTYYYGGITYYNVDRIIRDMNSITEDATYVAASTSGGDSGGGFSGGGFSGGGSGGGGGSSW